jgi:exopolysaccharide production protein ExoZ
MHEYCRSWPSPAGGLTHAVGKMISNLQVLRGLAALAVVFYHTAFTFNGGIHTEFQAVSVFFVISGFIMTYITRADTKQFLQQRLIRIVPLYWLCTLGALAAVWLLKDSGRTWTDAGIGNVLKSLLFVPYRDVHGETQPILPVGWTLNLEMFFYVLFALALVVSRRWGPLLTCIALVAFKIVPRQLGCSALLCEFYAHDYTAFLILGILSFYIWSGIKGIAEDWPSIAASVAILSALVFVLWNAHPPFADALQQRVGFPLYYAMPPLLVLSVLVLHSARLSCTWSVPLLLGDASYALYLTHIMVMELALIIRNKTIGDQVAAINPSESVMAVLGALVVCSLVAIAVHTKVELPTLRILRRLLIKRSDPSKLPVPRPA